MPIDASIPLGIKPVRVQDPLETYSKILGIRGERQRLEVNDQTLIKSRQDVADKQRADNADKVAGEQLAANTTQDADGNVVTDYRTAARGIAAAGHGATATKILTQGRLDDAARIESHIKQLDSHQKNLDFVGNHIGVLSNTPDEDLPAAYDRTVDSLVQSGISKPGALQSSAQVMAQGGLQQLRKNIAEQGEQVLSVKDKLIQDRENAKQASDVAKTLADIQQKKPETVEKWLKAISTVTNAGVSDQESLTAAKKDLMSLGAPLELLRQVPDKFTPEFKQKVQDLGMTAAERETAKRDTQTQKNQEAQRAVDQDRLEIERGGLNLRIQENQQKTKGSLGALSETQKSLAQKVADGDLTVQQLSRLPDKEAILSGAIEINPDWSTNTAATKKSFTDPASKQSQNLGTISRIVGHIGRFESNSNDLGFSPSLLTGVKLTGSASKTAEDAHAIAAELEKLVSGGVGTAGQVKAWQDALLSSRQGIRQSAIDEISQLIGSQFEGMNQTYKAGLGKDLPLEKFATPEAKKWLARQGINVGETSAAKTSDSGIPTIKNDTDYNALPAGTEFIDPQGKKRKKP